MCTCENQTQRWQPAIQPADSKKSANFSFTEGERWTPKDGRNGHHRADTRANKLVRRYCDSTKERRWGADLHWLQKAEHCDQAWKICLTDSWGHPSQTEGIHHLYQVRCDEWILANSTERWISQTHRALHLRQRFSSAPWKRWLQERSVLCVSSMTSWCSVKTKGFTKNTWRTPWKNWTVQASSWTKRSVSFVSRRLTLWALSSTKMAWKQTQEKPINPRNAWPHRCSRDTPFSRYGQLPRSLPSESVFSSPASHRTPREGQSVDVGAASDQCSRQSQRCWLLLQHLLSSIQTRLQQWLQMRAAMGLAQFFCESTQMDSVLLPLLLELSQRARESTPK